MGIMHHASCFFMSEGAQALPESARTLMENLEKSWNFKNGYFQAWKRSWK